MTDIASVVQSTVGIAAVGVKVSKLLYQAGHRAASPQHNVHRIATSVSGFSLTLRLLASILQGPSALHTPAALESLEQILKDAGALFQDFTTLVIHARDKVEPAREPVPANGRRRRYSVVARVKYYFEQPYIHVLIAQLDYLNATLNALLKTLDVAATSARLTRSGKSVPEVNQELNHEKLHLETLIIAQQMTINVMQDAQGDYNKQRQSVQADESLPEIERAAEQRYPKLLTQNAGADFDPLRLCDESMDFLDPRPTVAGDDESYDASNNRSERVVDSLLQRWTNAPTDTLEQTSDSDDRLHALNDLHDDAVTTCGEQTPELRGGSADHHNSGNPLPTSPGPTTHWLKPETAGPSRRSRSPRPVDGRRSPAISDIEHNETSRPTSRGGLPFTPPPPPFPSSGASALPTRDTTLDTSLREVNANSARRPVLIGRSSSNYRRPHVSSGSSSDDSSDSDDEGPSSRSKRRASTSSKHSHHDSGIGDGLLIPWRIRITASKYFDFRDQKLVGPRTPYLPSESRQWIYSHDNATTEISKKWVAEAAVVEKKYVFANLREDQSSDAICGSEGAWRIMQALRFDEIEELVMRTIELFRQQSPSLPNATGPTRPPPPPAATATVASAAAAAAAATATASVPHSREKQPYARGKSYQAPAPPPLAPAQSSQHRSVSFNDAVHSGGAIDSRPPRPLPGPSPLHAPMSPAMANAGPNSPLVNAPHRRGPPPTPDWHRDSYSGPPAPPRDRAMYDREYPREAWEREHHREKPVNRGAKHRHHHRERERERDRGAEKREDDKRRGKSSMPGTLAKVGGLWALLEGLDGI